MSGQEGDRTKVHWASLGVNSVRGNQRFFFTSASSTETGFACQFCWGEKVCTHCRYGVVPYLSAVGLCFLSSGFFFYSQRKEKVSAVG